MQAGRIETHPSHGPPASQLLCGGPMPSACFVWYQRTRSLEMACAQSPPPACRAHGQEPSVAPAGGRLKETEA